MTIDSSGGLPPARPTALGTPVGAASPHLDHSPQADSARAEAYSAGQARRAAGEPTATDLSPAEALDALARGIDAAEVDRVVFGRDVVTGERIRIVWLPQAELEGGAS